MISLLYRLADAARQRARGDADRGRRGEDLAHRYLRRRGCTIVGRNYRPPSGAVEVDLIAWHHQTLVFVEVKSRASDEFGAPEGAVDREKQGYLIRAARDYARRSGVEWSRVRFDIVSVVFDRPPRVEWIEDAFR